MVKPLREVRSNNNASRVRDSGRSMHVLVVDDDHDVCQLLETALVALNKYSVDVCNDAQACIAALSAHEHTFDGIFLDIQMPNTTGIELCKIIRGTPGYRYTPIIMLTAMSEQEFLREAFAAGASDYITKPFDLTDIKFRFSQERMRSYQHMSQRERAAQMGHKGSSGLSDTVPIAHVDRCITKQAFNNYVVKTSERGDPSAFVKATKIANVFDLYSTVSADHFQAVLTEIAGIMSSQTNGSNDLITYCGNGVFLSLCIGASDLKVEGLAKQVQSHAKLSFLAGLDCQLGLIVGDEIPLFDADEADAFHALKAAIEAAEQAEGVNSGWRSYLGWLKAKKSVGCEQRYYHEAGYKKALNDILKEGERGQAWM